MCVCVCVCVCVCWFNMVIEFFLVHIRVYVTCLDMPKMPKYISTALKLHVFLIYRYTFNYFFFNIVICITIKVDDVNLMCIFLYNILIFISQMLVFLNLYLKFECQFTVIQASSFKEKNVEECSSFALLGWKMYCLAIRFWFDSLMFWSVLHQLNNCSVNLKILDILFQIKTQTKWTDMTWRQGVFFVILLLDWFHTGSS